jgi:hypothetical protein
MYGLQNLRTLTRQYQLIHDPQAEHSHRDIMRDNMLVNMSGLEGHTMAIDINIEHLIGQLKVISVLVCTYFM